MSTLPGNYLDPDNWEEDPLQLALAYLERRPGVSEREKILKAQALRSHADKWFALLRPAIWFWDSHPPTVDPSTIVYCDGRVMYHCEAVHYHRLCQQRELREKQEMVRLARERRQRLDEDCGHTHEKMSQWQDRYQQELCRELDRANDRRYEENRIKPCDTAIRAAEKVRTARALGYKY